jgi:hypothetical protein
LGLVPGWVMQQVMGWAMGWGSVLHASSWQPQAGNAAYMIQRSVESRKYGGLMMTIACCVAQSPQLVQHGRSSTALLKVHAGHLRFGLQTSLLSVPLASGWLQAQALQGETQLDEA